MARKVFHTFHFKRDSQRVSQVRNMGVIEGQPVLSGNDWEKVKRAGDAAIERWINENMSGRSCVVVLIGGATAGRKWVNYEIRKAWNEKRGLVGVHIHKLKDLSGAQSAKGANPFESVRIGGTPLSSICKTYDSPYPSSADTYAYIKANLESWVEEGISIRNSYK